MEETAILFNYKGKDIVVREYKGKYQMGIRGEKGIDIWLENGVYNSIKLVKTSGREYARIVIDKMIVSRKKEAKSR